MEWFSYPVAVFILKFAALEQTSHAQVDESWREWNNYTGYILQSKINIRMMETPFAHFSSLTSQVKITSASWWASPTCGCDLAVDLGQDENLKLGRGPLCDLPALSQTSCWPCFDIIQSEGSAHFFGYPIKMNISKAICLLTAYLPIAKIQSVSCKGEPLRAYTSYTH